MKFFHTIVLSCHSCHSLSFTHTSSSSQTDTFRFQFHTLHLNLYPPSFLTHVLFVNCILIHMLTYAPLHINHQAALLSLNNPKQTLKRMTELMVSLGAQLDVLCRRHEDFNGPSTAAPSVSPPVQHCYVPYISLCLYLITPLRLLHIPLPITLFLYFIAPLQHPTSHHPYSIILQLIIVAYLSVNNLRPSVLQDYPKVASETWVADTPTLTPYKSRTRTLSCALLAQHIDSVSDTESSKSPKAGFDLAVQLENVANTQTIGGIDSRDNTGIAYARDMPPITVDTSSQDECRTPRDHSQVQSCSRIHLNMHVFICSFAYCIFMQQIGRIIKNCTTMLFKN